MVDRKCLGIPLCAGPTSSETHFAAPTSDETHQIVSFVLPFSSSPSFSPIPMSRLVSVPDQQPSDHITFRPETEMNQLSTEPKPSVRTRWWNWRNIGALFKEVCRSHQRDRPLGEPPGVGASIVAVLKTSCEQSPTR